MQKQVRWVLLVYELARQILGTFKRPRWPVLHLLHFNVLDEERPAESELVGEIFNAALLRNLNLVTLEGLLAACGLLTLHAEAVVVVRAQVADQLVEVVEVALVAAVLQLQLVGLQLRVDLGDPLQEV